MSVNNCKCKVFKTRHIIFSPPPAASFSIWLQFSSPFLIIIKFETCISSMMCKLICGNLIDSKTPSKRLGEHSFGHV